MNSNLENKKLNKQILELKEKSLLLEKGQREIYQGLSDIYREYNKYVGEMLDNYIHVLPKSLRLDLNSIIPTYLDHKRYIERKEVYEYIQELRDLILPNIENWYFNYFNDTWNWEFFIWLYEMSNTRNIISHLFYDNTNKESYKQNLKSFQDKLKNENLCKTINNLDKYKKYINDFIYCEINY